MLAVQVLLVPFMKRKIEGECVSDAHCSCVCCVTGRFGGRSWCQVRLLSTQVLWDVTACDAVLLDEKFQAFLSLCVFENTATLRNV
jgi:hypothetical protein